MIEKYEGELEVDTLRGVIYFHSTKTGTTLLRIQGLPVPLPQGLIKPDAIDMMDINVAYDNSFSWKGEQ
jgi:hypothetical protein